MSIFKCKMCGGTLEINENQTTATCEYCGTHQTLPKLDDDRRANLYDRANHFRRSNEFDKAMAIYENILSEDNTDAEAYWSLVLCHYGIEYVEDPSTHKRVPTVNRAQFTSIFDDDNYKSAISYADSHQKSIYEDEAKTINEIQKGILAISQQEEPFDVFICYKETDNNGRRTQDSVLANDLYHQLTAEGFKVFFSRITLEDKLGVAYEPYIFAALNSARVMVVLGTKAEYFNAVWVKNEWSRYLALVKQSAGGKVLIPAYKDMDPYDLPEEFSHLQAQDMSKLGFMQDLIRGIRKLLDGPKVSNTAHRISVADTQSVASGSALLKRGQIALKDHEWDKAESYFERVLDENPESSQAYLGKVFSANQCENLDVLGQRFIDEAIHGSNGNKAQISAGSPASSRISKAASEYEVPEFLTRTDIQKSFDYSLAYASVRSHYETQLAAFISFCTDSKDLQHALAYANTNERKEIETFQGKVRDKLQELIDKAKADDENSKNSVLQAYERFLDDVEKRLKQRHTDAVAASKKATADKRKKTIICVIASVVAVALFIVWAIFQTNANADRAAVIEANLVGENLKYTDTYNDGYYSSYDFGFKSDYVYEYTFKDNGKVEYYHSSSTKYNDAWKNYNKSKKDTFDESTSTYDYSVSVGLFGGITVTINGTSYTLEVDAQDNPVSMKSGDRIYD